MGGPLKSLLAALVFLFTLSTAHAAGLTQPPPFNPVIVPMLSPPVAPFTARSAPAGVTPGTVRAFRLSAPIDAGAVRAVTEFLERARQDHTEIVMIEMTTSGGSYGAGHDISRQIENSPVTVVCVADSMVASMGLYILQSCDRRVITTRGILMAHSALTSTPKAMENEHDLQNKVNLLKALNRAYGSHVVLRANITIDQYLARIADGKEWWINADEALKVGLADTIWKGTPSALLKALKDGQRP